MMDDLELMYAGADPTWSQAVLTRDPSSQRAVISAAKIVFAIISVSVALVTASLDARSYSYQGSQAIVESAQPPSLFSSHEMQRQWQAAMAEMQNRGVVVDNVLSAAGHALEEWNMTKCSTPFDPLKSPKDEV